jgi:hypothetical protein
MKRIATRSPRFNLQTAYKSYHTVLAKIGEVPLGRRSSMEEESRPWRQIAESEAQRDEVPEKPGANPAGTLC